MNLLNASITPKIACDYGGTLAPRFSERYLPPYPEALEVLGKIKESFKSCFIITRRKKPEHELLLRTMLQRFSFHEITGIDSEHVLCCRQTGEKIQIYEKLGITHLISDRAKDFQNLPKHTKHLFMFGANNSEEVQKLGSVHTEVRVTIFWRWRELHQLITPEQLSSEYLLPLPLIGAAQAQPASAQLA